MNTTALTLTSRQDISDADLISIAQQAERLGYDTFWTGESWGRDAFTVLTMIACHTHSLRLGTGIVPVFSRTPSLIAQSIASLDLISQGRATLGLGTSGRLVIEQWHGLAYESPLARTREYIEIIRTALAGQSLNYQGRFFQLGRFRLGAPPLQPHIPIYLASLGPKNLELTGQLADGWLPIWVHHRRLPELKEQIAEAATQAGRDVSQITVAPQILCYVTETPEELTETERQTRSHMAYYIAGMGQYYYNLFCRFGFQAEADAVREAWGAGQRAKAAAAISDEMVENIPIIGDAATCRAKLDQFRRDGADMPVIAFPHGSDLPGIQRTLEALAPGNHGQSASKP
jgi:F420-dependent oxidoreductase-like protein